MSSLFSSNCVFPCPEIEKTAEFYAKKMGFSAVPYLDAAEPHICLYRDKTEIILTKANREKFSPNRVLYGYGYDAYFITDTQKELEKELSDKGVKIVRSLFKTDYHNQEFVIEDCDGRWIGFGMKENQVKTQK
jgi:hypothetical protein